MLFQRGLGEQVLSDWCAVSVRRLVEQLLRQVLRLRKGLESFGRRGPTRQMTNLRRRNQMTVIMTVLATGIHFLAGTYCLGD